MPDWGPGFKKGTERPECTKHGRDYMAGYVNDEDIGCEMCLACVPPHELTTKGKRLLAQKRSALSAKSVLHPVREAVR